VTALPERIRKDLIQAMKAKERLRVGTLRMMTAALKNKEIEKRAPLSDEEAVQVLKTQLKQRAESIEQFERGGRTDLVEKERQEKIWIESYLPEPLSAEDMEKVVADVIREVGAVGAKDMGVVMRESMRRLQATGKMVDGKAVNSMVRRKLQSLPENASKEPE